LTVVHRDQNGLWTSDVATGTGVRWIDGHLRAEGALQFTAWFGPVPRAIVAGRVRVGATTRFGTASAPAGDRVSPLPPPLDADL